MLNAKFTLVVGLFVFAQTLLSAQNLQITYKNSDSLFVCGADTFFIQIHNQFINPVADAVVQITLPAGLQYAAGSVSGAIELNINNLSAPTFSIPVLPGQQSHPFYLLINAQCEAADLLDAGQLFQAILSLTSASGNVQVVTTSIPVETGALVIQSITPTILSGEKGDTLYRTICFKNTRLGKIGNLHFQDEHQDGFEVFVQGADLFQQDPGLAKAEFGPNLFQTIGNSDEWLDQNESVCIIERVIITDCGIPPVTRFSTLRAGWGCGVDWCRYDSLLSLIEIKTSTKIPELDIVPIWSPPKDYCGEIPAVMGFNIRNIGKADATNVVFNVQLTEGFGQAGIATGSFRIVSALSTQTITPSLSSQAFLPGCGKAPLLSANFLIPLVPALDSILFLFDVITCVDPCDQVEPEFKADFFFQKACPLNGFSSGNAEIKHDEDYAIETAFFSNLDGCMLPDVSYPFTYRAVSQYLLEDGFWHLSLRIPKSITIDPACGLSLGNQSPVLFEASLDNSGDQIVHLAWKTPLANDTVFLNYCLKLTCDTTVMCGSEYIQPGVIYNEYCCFQDMLDTSYWTLALQTPKECGVSNCDGRPIGISLACSQDDYDPDIGIGGNSYILGVSSNSNAYRKNTGFQDSDDNRKADLPLNIATDNLRTDRFLPGDTIHVALWAAIDSFILIDSIYYSILHEVIASDMGEDDNDIFVTETSIDGFVGQNTIIPVGSSLRIKYANGQEVICDFDDLIETKAGNYIRLEKPNVFPAEALDELTNIRFLHLLPLPEMMNNGCLPSQFLALGDSLFITKDYKINSNFKPASSNAPDPPLVGFRTAATLGIANSAWNFLPSFKMQYSGWNLSRTVNQHTIKPCALSTEPKKFKYSMRIARENMFPNEVRPLGWISEYGQTNPEGLELQSAMLEYLVLQDSTPWLSNLTLPFIQAPLDLQIDFSPAFLDPIDEGYTLRTNLIFKPDCQFSLPDSSIQFMKTTFNGCLNGDEMTRADTIRNPIGFFAYTPRFTLITTDSIVNSPTRAFSVEFPLKNALVSPAPYAWVYVDAPSGLVNQLELIQLPQNQSVTGNNGFFGLGQFNGLSTKDFKLIGESLSCSLDSVYIYYGWSCDPIQQISDATCGIDTTLIFLNLERPELELEIHQEPDQITLCEISDWFEFEVYNAKSGYAYELLSTLKLPAGLKIAAGTSQISYPEGSAWVNIPDPMEASSSFYEWQVSDLLPVVAMNGLPGFNVAPQNSFRIRFKVVAECGFVANTPIVYGTTGTEPCGRQANLLNKLGEPLNVVGVTPSYGVQINIQPFGNLADGCGEIQEFEVNMQLLGTPSPTDSVYISLPQGVHILPTTYLPGTNAPAGPLVINIQGFQLPLPILQGGGPVSFRFKVSYDGIAGCSDKIIQVQTRVRTEAFCASLGAPCVVYVATGESIWNINVEHPTLVITSANFMLTNGETQAEVTITNSGDIITHWAEVDFYHDVNANGVVDAGDVLLGGFVQNASGLLLPGESITLEGTVPGLDSQGWCNLLIVLPANDNCLCSDQIFQPEQWQIAHTELKFCALEPVQLGIPGQIGYTYLWQANSGISCLTCPTITFTPDSSISLNTPIELELTEMDGNCIVRHHFLLSFSTVAGITASDQTVCKGQSVSLSAIPTSGDAYLWTGSGIMDPTLATQTILAQINSTYTVTISFANGCTASKSIDIQVLEPDTVVLPGLITCQGVPVNILGNTTETPGTYQLLLSNSQGCDSLVFQSLAILPPIETVESFTFCLGDTLKNVLDTSFTTSGQVCRTYQNLNGCDSVHCAIVTAVDPPDLPVQDTLYVEYGQLITLSGPSGFESYWWIPAPTPPCEDCQEVTYPADSTAYQEYRLQVIDANGCSGELIFRVLVLPPCSPDSLHIPNAFTPNGDGSNDVFRVVPYESSEVISSLEIYNRWGQKVYENFGNSSWDGTIDGQPASSDVYVYIVTIQCGELVGKRVGDVTLLR